ncbi:MAG: SLBB domain-containing protein [bacterium]
MRRWLAAGLAGALLTGCAGGAPPGELKFPEEAVQPLRISEDSFPQTLEREPHPHANSVFVTIEGIPYYRLGPGDRLELRLWQQQDTRVLPLRVSPAGDLRLPNLLPDRPIRVAGLAVPQAEARVSEALSEVLRRPRVSLQVTGYESSRVTLLGELQNRGTAGSPTGRHALSGRITLLDFILAHAAFTDQSDLSAVIITDARGRSAMFDLTRTIYQGEDTQNPYLDRGDRVTVPSVSETQRTIYVLGEVTRPSLVPPRPGMRLLDALALSGGISQDGNPRWVNLVRGRGADAEIHKIPYGDILKKGEAAWNVPLAGGDIVYVGRSGYDQAIEFFRDTWSILQTAVVATILVDRL